MVEMNTFILTVIIFATVAMVTVLQLLRRDLSWSEI